MVFKKGKCVELTKAEYDDIQFIISISSCMRVGMENIGDYLIKDHKVSGNIDSWLLGEIEYNLYIAVSNNYKYLKVK